jgi:glycosyltransferase involved in cell wall biosynthesis
MRVAFVLGTASGGTGLHVRMLSSSAEVSGTLSGTVFGPAQTQRDLGFDAFVPVEISGWPRFPGVIWSLRRRTRGYDVVHAHGLRAGALAALALGYPRRSRLIVTVHNAPPAGRARWIYLVLERIVARGARSVLCVSGDLEDRMRAAGARRVGRAVVSCTVPVPGSDPGSAPRGEPLVLAVGRLAAQKGFDVLIAAAAGWRDLDPPPHLMIAGEGPLFAALEAQAGDLGVPVEFAGRRSDVASLLAGAAVFVQPSRWEGQSLVLQEALRAGAAIVTTRAGGSPDVTGEDAAILVPPGDPAALGAAVRAVLTDPGLASRLRKAALDRAGMLPTPADAIAAAVAEYRLVSGSPSAPGRGWRRR